MDAYTVKLIQKMTLAEAALKKISTARHAKDCPVEREDPTALTGPACTCGADAINAAVKEALGHLNTDN